MVHQGLTFHNSNRLTYRDRPIYWRPISAPVLGDLEKLIIPDFRPDIQQVLTGEVLFGMAASVVSARQPEFREKYAQYIRYAAHAGSVAAQGIVGRLLEARSATSAEDDQVRLSWLETAVSTGSLVAAEDLQKLDAGLLEISRKTFRDKGGYNSESHDSHGPWENQQANLFELTVQSASALCDSLEPPDGRCYRKSNTMLHFAAMHGNCSVISYLVQERGASIDIQNDAGETPLYKACLSANFDAVRTLIAFRASATIPAKATGASCLHWLFNFEADEMREVAELLIRQGGGDVNAEVVPPIARGEILPIAFEHFPFHWPFGTPLHWAVAARSKYAVETLLEFQCDINAPDLSGAENGQTALTMAMYRADSEMSEMLVTNGAKVDKIDARGRNIIHMLAVDHTHMNRAFPLPRSIWSWVTHGSSQSHLKQLQRCLAVAQDLGLDLNAVRRKCQTPLIDAIENSDACTMIVLLDAGADANVVNPMGETTLHEWLGKDGRDLAYSELYLPVTERLVSLTKDLNKRDELYLESAIHRVAVTNGDQEQFEASLQMLLAKDPPADINTQDCYGRTPFLKMLGSSCAGEIAQRSATFIQVHADVLLKDSDGKGFLFVLCENESLSDHETYSILTSILEHFSKPEQQVVARTSGLPEQGPNALTPAIREAKFLCVKLLVELGVDIDALDARRRWTPLDCAIAIGDAYRETIIKTLLDSIGPADRQDALEDGTAFTTNFLETGKIHRTQLATF